VVDGHNRYDIATRHGLSFQITEKEFDTREDVVNWIINNQLGRRNLTEQQKMYLRGKRYENEKKKITDNLKVGSNSPIGQNDHSGEKTKFDYPQNTTARKIADEYGVGPSTIQRDAWYSKGVDVLPEETKEKIFTGEEKATKNEVRAIAKMEPKLQKKVVKIYNKIIRWTEWSKMTFYNKKNQVYPLRPLEAGIIEQIFLDYGVDAWTGEEVETVKI
jgi:hypothetical protein